MDRLEDDCGPRAGYDLLWSAPGLGRRAGLENPRKWNIPFGYWVTEGRGILEGGGGDASLLGIVTRSYLSAVPTDFREARPKVWPPISRD